MIKMADEVFAVKDDPDQLNVNQEVIRRLRRLHPSTISEYNDGSGPVAWILLIPTTLGLMKRFLKMEINEKELFEMTFPGDTYEAIYLCSAMVLEEYRRKGIMKKLTLSAIHQIRKDHLIKALFVWSFTQEGERASEKIAELTSLPLFKRDKDVRVKRVRRKEKGEDGEKMNDKC
jgi:hypothetical protein